MTKDLTDHVRERDEAEGEHKPVTDAEAKEIERRASNTTPYWVEYEIRRLLADRDVAMEIIDELAKHTGCYYSWSTEHETCAGEDKMCVSCKARAFIAAVKGE